MTDSFWNKKTDDPKKGNDPVSPNHYKKGKRECIDFIEAALGKEGFKSFCVGNVMKYVWRHSQAGGAKDIRKAKRYLEYWLAAEARGNIDKD